MSKVFQRINLMAIPIQSETTSKIYRMVDISRRGPEEDMEATTMDTEVKMMKSGTKMMDTEVKMMETGTTMMDTEVSLVDTEVNLVDTEIL